MSAAGRARGSVLATVALSLAAWAAFSGSARAQERVRIGDFLIDRTEVTIAQFARFAQDTGRVTKAERDGGSYEYVGGWRRRAGWNWRRPDGVPPATDALPAVHVTHAEAADYCRWAGGRLPAAREWIEAAYTERRDAPPSPWIQGRTYPYPTGDTPSGANTSASDPWPRAAPAGATAAGVNGLFDMGANVWEWASDASGDERRTLGGSWWYGAEQMRADVIAWKSAGFHAVYVGFRCVYDAAPGRRP